MRKRKPTWSERLAVLSVLLLVPLTAWAQAESTPGPLGLGGHVGDPSGIAVRFHPRLGQAFDAIIALDRERYRYVTGHVLIERFLPDSPLQVYAGPGFMVGSVVVRGELRYALGPSFMVGGQFYRGRIGVFFHALPQLRLLPEHQFNAAAGVGFRYYPRWR